MEDNTSLQTYKNYTNGIFDRDKAILNAQKAKCAIITDKTIQNVPTPNDYKDTFAWINSIIASACRITLNESRSRVDDYTYGEVGNAITIIDANIYNRVIHGPVYGKYKSVRLVNGEMVQKLRSQYANVQGAIICVHNHPSNGPCSFPDICNMLEYAEISAIAIVGNTSWMYFLSKMTNTDYRYYHALADSMKDELSKLMLQGISKHDAQVRLALQLLNNSTTYNLYFRAYRRRG